MRKTATKTTPKSKSKTATKVDPLKGVTMAPWKEPEEAAQAINCMGYQLHEDLVGVRQAIDRLAAVIRKGTTNGN